MPFAAIEITKLVGGWISHCFDECGFIYTSYSCLYIIRQILGFVNVSGGTRTPDQLIRSEWLYPSELPKHVCIIPVLKASVKGRINPPHLFYFYTSTVISRLAYW